MQYWSSYRLKNQDNGVAAIEFALVLPVMLLTLIGVFDVNNLIYCNNKINRTAQQISNIVTRGNLTQPQLDSILSQVPPRIAQPFDFVQFGNVIVTAVSKPSASLPAQVVWQDSYPGGVGGSKINPASLPGGLVLNTKQTVIFTEVFFAYQPLIANYVISANTNLYAVAASVPRQGTMATLPSS
ncbi:MAG: pilus assembly protein [Proteobacteria bacterium]|nr:pilus assembly protein [Pseudomonadota bacterium]